MYSGWTASQPGNTAQFNTNFFTATQKADTTVTLYGMGNTLPTIFKNLVMLTNDWTRYWPISCPN